VKILDTFLKSIKEEKPLIFITIRIKLNQNKKRPKVGFNIKIIDEAFLFS